MPGLLTENVLTFAKVETTYGVDAVPTAAEAIKTSQVKLTPLGMTTVARNLDKPNSGSDQELVADYWAEIEFTIELVGSGTLGTAPAYGKLLKACRCAENIVATTSVTYTPSRASTTSLSMYFYLDGNHHKLLGARGTFTLEMNSQGIPVLKFKFTGLYVPPSASANPTNITGWSAFQVPTPVNYDNTPTATLHGYSGVFKSFTFDMGGDVKRFNNPGEREVRVVKHMSKGKLSMLAPPIGTKDYFTIAKNATLGTMKMEHGSTAATKVFFECASATCQIVNPTYGDDEGRVTLDTDLIFVPTDAGGDEWQLRFAAT